MTTLLLVLRCSIKKRTSSSLKKTTSFSGRFSLEREDGREKAVASAGHMVILNIHSSTNICIPLGIKIKTDWHGLPQVFPMLDAHVTGRGQGFFSAILPLFEGKSALRLKLGRRREINDGCLFPLRASQKVLYHIFFRIQRRLLLV